MSKTYSTGPWAIQPSNVDTQILKVIDASGDDVGMIGFITAENLGLILASPILADALLEIEQLIKNVGNKKDTLDREILRIVSNALNSLGDIK